MGKRKKVTTRDIAEYTGLSQSTVSMILSGRPNVSFTPETVQQVKEAARKLGYKKQEKKRIPGDLILKDTLVVIEPHLSNGYHSAIIHSIVEHAPHCGYCVLTVTTFRQEAREEAALKLLEQSPPAGIILLYPPSRKADLNRLAKQIPVVSIGENPAGSHYDSVELDSRKTGRMMGDYLLSLGHRKAAYLCAPVNKREFSRLNRFGGVRDSFQNAGLSPDQVVLLSPSAASFAKYSIDEAEYKNGYDMGCLLLKEHSDCTALIGHNDMTAMGALAALADHRKRIPADYSVCGFDNITLSGMPQISLTTIDHSSSVKGREAVEIIYRKNKSRDNKDKNPYIMRMEYEPKLIVRSSSGKARTT